MKSDFYMVVSCVSETSIPLSETIFFYCKLCYVVIFCRYYIVCPLIRFATGKDNCNQAYICSEALASVAIVGWPLIDSPPLISRNINALFYCWAHLDWGHPILQPDKV